MSAENNILLVANWDSDTGYAWWLMENFWVAISEHFRTQGKRSFLIYPSISTLPDAVANSDIQTSECNFHDHSLGGLTQLHTFIKQNNIKHIYLTDCLFYTPFYVLLRLWGVSSIVVHDHTPGERATPSFAKRLVKTIIQRLPLITADHFIAVTEFVYQRFIQVACIPPHKCSTATNGIVPINLDNSDRSYAQRVLGIPGSRTIIVTTGRASYYKGIDFFIECAHELVNNRGLHQLHFLYCGDGPDLNDFKAMATQYKLDEHFTFAGSRSDVREILPSCHIGFHAATGEVGYSLSILEYMSAGLIPVVPDRPSTSLAITNRENGLLYEYRNLSSATDAIVDALYTDNRDILRRNAITLIRDKYNIEHTNDKLLHILDAVFFTQS